MNTSLAHAVDVLNRGGVVCHACEGVWGLACDPFDESAVSRILEIKNRPIDKGLIVIGGDAAAFQPELSAVDSKQYETIRASWPGHTTWILPNKRFPRWITGEFDTVAARVPGHAQSRDLASKFGGPLVSTSANRSGQQELTTLTAVEQQFRTEVDYILEGSVGDASGPSKIFDARTGEKLR